MARQLRIEYDGALYHITVRGNERGKIFFTKRDYLKFKEYLAEAELKYCFLLHAYVLMTNHFHLIVGTPHGNLSKIMHHLNGSYATYVNVKRKRSGHLFQGRYKAILVDKDRYLLELSRYLHLNPVRANMVARAEEYPYSSYGSYISDVKEEIVSTSLVLGLMPDIKNSAEMYRAYMESSISDELPCPMAYVYGGVLLGSGEFIHDVLTHLRDEQTNNVDISHRRDLRVRSDEEQIIAVLDGYYGVTPVEAAADRHSEARNAGVHLLKKYAGITNTRIGELYGGLSYSAISKISQSVIRKLEVDRGLQQRMGDLDRLISNFKG